MQFFRKAKEILGMNARNILYISKYNSQTDKKFADDKFFTKNFLHSRGIEVAKLYHIIKDHKELNNFDFNKLPTNFVIKPNKGYGGEGIFIINKKENNFTDINGLSINNHEIYKHCNSIIDGKYAISDLYDSVIIEEKLEAHKYFSKLNIKGLPDIRIIVFNFVPIIAMLRLPTSESAGKANLHLGGIGIGIDIGTGKATYAVQHNKFIKKLPNGLQISEIEIPKWEDLLITSAKIQQITKIGYLAVDLVLTTSGIKVLETNARAGLSVQIANKVPLKARLEKIRDLKVLSPKQGVEISKTLFSKKPNNSINTGNQKILIGLYEPVLVLGEKNIKTTAKIDPHSNENLIDESIMQENEGIIELIIKDKRLKIPFKASKLKEKSYSVSLSGQYLKDFLIDPSNTSFDIGKSFKHLDEKIIENIDKKIFEIDNQIKLLNHLRPINLTEERERFLKNPIASPKFIYRNPSIDFSQIRKELNKIPREVDHPLLHIYLKKINEIELKINLLESINSVDFGYFSEALYGKSDRHIYKEAMDYISNHRITEDRSENIELKSVIKTLEHFLKEKKLSHWKIKIIDDSPTSIQVNKENCILISKNAKFTKNRLQAVITHEIETHIYRLENARMQKYRIFERGTSDYLATEEGLAIYNQQQLNLSLGIKEIQFAISAIAIYFGKKMTFCELFHYLKNTYHLDDERSFRTCVKVKRGLIDTTIKTAFTKDLVYFQGLKDIKTFLSNNHSIKQLYVGKISIKDIDTLDNIDLKEAKFLPSHLK